MKSEIIANLLLREKAVFLRPHDPFTWTSGIKSPVYCDNRLLISSVASRHIIVKALSEKVRTLKVQSVTGTATAGIPWAAWVAMDLGLPLLYVRSSVKEHGRQTAVEGKVEVGTKTVLIEDLISTGKSSIAAAKKLQEAELEVTQVLSLFTYGFSEVKDLFAKDRLSFESLTDFETLAHVAHQNHLLDQKTLLEVLEWKEGVKIS